MSFKRSALIFVFVAVLPACQSYATSKKQANPSKGDSSDQSIPVATPYCDAYLPYKFVPKSGTADNQVQQIFSGIQPLAVDFTNTPTNPDLNGFLSLHLSTSDPIANIQNNGTFIDPGYPIFGDPTRHLYQDGSDTTRLLFRLIETSNPKPIPLCLKSPSPPPAQTPPQSLESQYYLLNIVRWKLSDGGAYQISTSDWYVFNKSDGQASKRQFPFTFHPYVTGDLRIFGSQKVFFLAVHLAPDGSYSDFSSKLKISYKMKVKKVEPANIQDLKALIGIITGNGATPSNVQEAPELAEYRKFLSDSQSRDYAGLYGAAGLTNLKNLPVQITSTMTAQVPAANKNLSKMDPYSYSGFWDKLQSAESSASPAAPKAANTGSSATSSSASSATPSSDSSSAASSSSKNSGSTVGSPSGPSCTTVATDSSGGTCTESLTVQNEGLYRWDVSIGVPFNSITQLNYTQSNGQVTTANVSKGTAYGFLVLAPWKEDFLSPPSLGIPHILVGIPLLGKVLNSPFVGAGETFNVSKLPSVGPALSKVIPISIRFYAGLVESKTFGPKPPSGPTPYKWIGKLQYGIEFSVRDVASKLTGKSSSTKSSTNSKNSKSSSSGS